MSLDSHFENIVANKAAAELEAAFAPFRAELERIDRVINKKQESLMYREWCSCGASLNIAVFGTVIYDCPNCGARTRIENQGGNQDVS